MGRKKGSKNKCSPINKCSRNGEHLKEVNITKEDQERQNKLKAVLRDINKNIEGATVDYASNIKERERLSWGYKCLDDFTGGGLVKGLITTIWGAKSCGKTTIAYKAIAKAQKQGKIAVYIDMERSYDSIWAKKIGVDIDKLVYIKCNIAEEAFDSIIKLCKEKVVDLIILDSIHGLCPKGEKYIGKANKEKSTEDDTMALLARKLSQFFRMSISYISEANCAVLLIGQSRKDLGSFVKCEVLSGGNALAHNSRLILRIRRGQKADSPTEIIELDKVNEKGKKIKEKKIIGFDCVIKAEKSQINGCLEGDEIHLPFNYKSGIKGK